MFQKKEQRILTKENPLEKSHCQLDAKSINSPPLVNQWLLLLGGKQICSFLPISYFVPATLAVMTPFFFFLTFLLIVL